MTTKQTNEMPRVAVLGMGTMGRAMATSIQRAGIPVVVWNRDGRLNDELAGSGLQVARSVPEATIGAEVVITMVTDAAAVASIATEHGLLSSLSPGAVWAQMSTIGVMGTEQIAELAATERPDISFVDAPVSGSKGPAEQGKLLIFASGPEESRGPVTPMFDALGQRTIWLGPAGNGSRMKLVNNTLLAFTAEGVANAVALAHRLGLDTASVIDAFDGGPLVSPWESAKLRRIEGDEFSAEFALALALKDVQLALDEGGPDRFKVLSALADEWTDIVERGLGNEDVTVVTRALSS